MTWIFLSVLCSVAVSVLLKLAPRYGVDVRQAITGNYLVAAVLTVVLLHPRPSLLTLPLAHPAWRVLLALGVLLPTIFLALARSVRQAGVVRTDAAQRLSLLLSLLAAFTVFGEALTWHRGIGVAIGLAAIVCIVLRSENGDRYAVALPVAGNLAAGRGRTTYPDSDSGFGSRPGFSGWWWLVLVFVGMGAIDILFKRVAQLTRVPFADVLLAAFTLAFVLAMAAMVWLYASRRAQWRWRHLGGAVLLGAFNFGNILFYIEAHRHLAGDPALVFSAMNIGVIVLATLVGAGFFRERLGRSHRIGLVLAVVAVAVLASA